jgi:hypothetical protein
MHGDTATADYICHRLSMPEVRAAAMNFNVVLQISIVRRVPVGSGTVTKHETD